MMLTRLEMQGFKSFAKKATLSFPAAKTAIVGPNGSGKSNVVEALRFVLGEQSIKSLRSKTGADLIFKGSRQLPKGNRASVSVTFDNKARVFHLTNDQGERIPIPFDEVTITREVFADGGNRYAVNGSDVRMRDIHEMIAHVNIGTTGHHIISQGEADRMLGARASERKTMLEESLGLRVFQYRIKESERKLEKTLEHMREADVARRELAPQVKFLKKQVEKIEKAVEMRRELAARWNVYRTLEENALADEYQDLTAHEAEVGSILSLIESKLSLDSHEAAREDIRTKEELIQAIRRELAQLQHAHEDVERQLGRLEGMLELLGVPEEEEVVELAAFHVSSGEVKEFLAHVDQELEHVRASDGSVEEVLALIKRLGAEWYSKLEGRAQSPRTSSIQKPDALVLQASQRELSQKKSEIQRDREEREHRLRDIEAELVQQRLEIAASEQERVKLVEERGGGGGGGGRAPPPPPLQGRRDAYLAAVERLREDAAELAPILDDTLVPSEQNFDTIDRASLRHEIERLKIRLEDMGGGGGGDLMREYEETSAREVFLTQQLADLSHAETDLRALISELRQTLALSFTEGLHTINKAFHEYFMLMFGGGAAKLVISHKKAAEGEEELEETADTLDGVTIDVSLPRKQVRDLEMLSGGERSLTSIALLFALSSVNPPPFLVLDETDAALDEANSRKYGDMIDRLSTTTQLIVVTHNRETMSRADVLYGVTLGGDDSSALVSVSFERAAAIAK